MPLPITLDASHLDLSPRLFTSTAVAASPSAAAETTVCTITCTGDIASLVGVVLVGTVAFTVGTSGTAVTYRIRRTDTNGTVVFTSGATTAGISAGNLVAQELSAFDAGGFTNGRVYVLTLQVTSGAAASTVSAANLMGLVV